jgi:4a-hydroxytetrahydrobiopterin dehydratase
VFTIQFDALGRRGVGQFHGHGPSIAKPTAARDNAGVPAVLLTDAEVTDGLQKLSGWSRDGDTITKKYERASFPDAIAFVVRIGFFAERADHHPDLDIRWRNVTVALSTHDAGGITAMDLSLAGEIEAAATGSV